MTTSTSTTEPAPPEPGATEPTFPPHRIKTDRYERMARTGVFHDKEPIFLWHGRLVEKFPKTPPHSATLTTLSDQMNRLVPDGWFTMQGQAVEVGDDSMPEPDLAIVRGMIHDYRDRYPTTRDIVLIAEVAEASLIVDSGEVLQTYAAWHVPIYWIVNLPKRQIEVYREPTGPTDSPGYRESRHYGPGDDIPVVLDGREVGRVAVADVLPRL